MDILNSTRETAESLILVNILKSTFFDYHKYQVVHNLFLEYTFGLRLFFYLDFFLLIGSLPAVLTLFSFIIFFLYPTLIYNFVLHLIFIHHFSLRFTSICIFIFIFTIFLFALFSFIILTLTSPTERVVLVSVLIQRREFFFQPTSFI